MGDYVGIIAIIWRRMGKAREVLQRGILIFEMIFVIAFLMVETLSLEN